MNKIDTHPFLAREGWFYTAIILIVTVLAFVFVGSAIGFICLLLSIFVLQFFRDPHRAIPNGENLLVSPADGKVIFAGQAHDPYLDREAFKISVFMNVFSVHSNRAPVAGEVKRVDYFAGEFVNAALDKASDKNERNAIVIRDEKGRDITSVQVAGLIARRILCYVSKGSELQRGQRYGFIRFGSRVDLYLPLDFAIKVAIGDNVSSGSSVLGEFPSD